MGTQRRLVRVPPAGGQDRALALGLDQIGDRWSLLIVRALLVGARRYNELSGDVVGIAPNVLAARLRHLEEQRLVSSTPYQERPRRLAYELTASGRELGTVLGALTSWAARQHGFAERGVHPTCGTPLVWTPWCPTCSTVVSSTELGIASPVVDGVVWM